MEHVNNIETPKNDEISENTEEEMTEPKEMSGKILIKNKPNSNAEPNKFSDFQIKSKIREGPSGIIYKAEFNGECYAIKQYKIKNFGYNECKTLVNLDHKNIIQLQWSFLVEDVLYNVYPRYKYDLFDYITKHGIFTESRACKLFLHLADALEYLHNKNIIHRDVKLENILYDDVLDRLILIDFDFAINLDKNPSQFLGTKNYMSPEIDGRNVYDNKVDIYCLGICIFCTIFNHYPEFVNSEKNRRLYIRGKKISNELTYLLGNMLSYDPSLRPNIKVVKEILTQCSEIKKE
jgi:serine/threonine protein kinase